MPTFVDRVKDTTTTTGTGDVTLSGSPPTGYMAFSAAFSVGTPRIPYAIAGQTGGEWEVGYGTLSGGTTLARTKVLASSNSGSAVNFSAGTKDVFVTIPGRFQSQMLPRGRVEMTRSGVMTL